MMIKKNRIYSHVWLVIGYTILILLYSFSVNAQNAPVTTLGTVGNVIPGQVAVPVTVTGFTDIGAISLSFDYQYGGLQFILGIPNPLLSGFAIGDHDMGNGKHRVTMGWFGSGVSLPVAVLPTQDLLQAKPLYARA